MSLGLWEMQSYSRTAIVPSRYVVRYDALTIKELFSHDL